MKEILEELVQVWFAGARSDIGGSYKPDKDGARLSGNALDWMVKEAGKAQLTIEAHLKQSINKSALATLHNSRRSFHRVKKKYYRTTNHGRGPILIHASVKERWENDDRCRPKNPVEYINNNGWPNKLPV